MRVRHTVWTTIECNYINRGVHRVSVRVRIRIRFRVRPLVL